jgi:hypothetical protein
MASRTGRPRALEQEEAGREKRGRQRQHSIDIVVREQRRLALHYLVTIARPCACCASRPFMKWKCGEPGISGRVRSVRQASKVVKCCVR